MGLASSPQILVLDHYDSFTYNLTDVLRRLGAGCEVIQHDRTSLGAILAAAPDGVLLSPGPGHPADAQCAGALVQHGRLPLLGICLGHQVIGLTTGCKVERARPLLHGKTCRVEHASRGLFSGLPSPFLAARYNSLCLAPDAIPACLDVTAVDGHGAVMGISHRTLPIHGVQFHPESVLSELGVEFLRGWLRSL
jgi:anthranilate synthase/aminodeoxychorismate synthase-like glutamine amidotransferase